MSGITSSTGLISNLDYGALIEQILSVEGRPKILAQRRLVELQSEQAAFLDLNSRMSAFRTAAGKFKAANIFKSAKATSTNDEVLTARAAAGAAVGSYSFLVDRTVSTHQSLSRGFANRGDASAGVTSITLEGPQGRLDTDTELSRINGGAGFERGRIVVKDRSGAQVTVDLSRAATVNEVLEKINGAEGVRVRARVDGDRFVIEDASGGTANALTITNATGSTAATSLGIERRADAVVAPGSEGAVTGGAIWTIGDRTTLASFNDGNGVRFNNAGGTSNPDFSIKTRDGTTYDIDIGDVYGTPPGGTALVKTASAVADVEGLRRRIEEQTQGKVTVVAGAGGGRLRLVDSSTPTGTNNLEVIDGSKGTASDLGIVGSTTLGTLDGRNAIASLNSTLAAGLAGGAGLADGTIDITARDGQVFSVSVTTDASVSQILRDISDQTGGVITAALNEQGTGLVLTDTTGGSSNLIVTGAGAAALGVATAPGGVAADEVSGAKVQRKYIADSTLLSSLNNGRGLGTGKFDILDSNGVKSATIDIGADDLTIQDVLEEINATSATVKARINEDGDGIELYIPVGVTPGASKIRVTDTSGAVAKGLNIAGEAKGTGSDNRIDGSFERTIDTTGKTLDEIVTAINTAKAGVTASVIRDGSGATPFRLKLTSTQTGTAGRFTVDAAGADLGLRTLSEGRNARVFFGSDDPARAVLIDSTTNSIDGVVDGLTIDLVDADDRPVTVSVGRDTEAIEEAVGGFVTAFNDVVSRINALTDYDQDTNRKGTLLGDGTAIDLRRSLFDAVLKPAQGVTGRYRVLAQVGFKIGTGSVLSFDAAKLRQAMEDDPEAVADLFAANERVDREEFTEVTPGEPGIRVRNTDPDTFRSLGVAEQLVRFADKWVNSVSGVLKRKTQSIDASIAGQRARIEGLDSQLERRRALLQRQFASLETTIAQLQRQQGALGQIPSN